MYICKVCDIHFNKATGTRAYISYCSAKCYSQNWNKNNSEKRKHINRVNKHWHEKVKQKAQCMICGFKKTLDLCHIKWRKDGGKITRDNIVILCPNHHRLFDRGLLSRKEKVLLIPVSQMRAT